MEHWFDELTKKVASHGLTRREAIGKTFAAGLGALSARLFSNPLGVSTGWLNAMAQMAGTNGCKTTRSGAARITSMTVDDSSGAILHSTITYKPGRKTVRSAGWTVTAQNTISKGPQTILQIKASLETLNSAIEIDFGSGYKGAKAVRLEVRNKRTVTGTVDGHALAPFSVGTKPKLADGRPLPAISVDPTTKATVGRIASGAGPVHKKCGGLRVESTSACDACSLACGAKFTSCLAAVAGGAWWELLGCFSSDDDCYSACNAPGGACCPAACEVDGGCCVNDGEICCGSGWSAQCCSPGHVCCGGLCCPQAGQVCKNQAASPVCCQPTDFVCPSGLCCQAGGTCCGTSCCAPGTHCADPKFGTCCPNGSVVCGLVCCGPPETSVCLNRTLCCKKSDVCGTSCCPGGPCVNNVCCPSPSHVCPGGNTCCPPFNVCCGSTCCGAGEICMKEGRTGQPLGCCPAKQACGVGGENPVCCPSGQVCVDTQDSTCGACPSGQVACKSSGNGAIVCCAPGVNCCNGTCCKPQEACCTNLHGSPQVYGCHMESLCIG
jgi:hypothetical protein